MEKLIHERVVAFEVDITEAQLNEEYGGYRL